MHGRSHTVETERITREIRGAKHETQETPPIAMPTFTRKSITRLFLLLKSRFMKLSMTVYLNRPALWI